MTQPLLLCEQLRYQAASKVILNQISLNVFAGDFITIIGPNGCGKSSLVNCLNQRADFEAKKLHFNGRCLMTLPSHKRSKMIATLHQNVESSTFGEFSIYENLLFVASCLKLEYSKDKAKRYLADFSSKLASNLDQPVESLSGGERQILGLAMCLIRQPKLLICDEFTSALDPINAKLVLEITQKQAIKNPDMAVIAITHSLKDALSYGNRLMIMREGSIVKCLNQQEKSQLSSSQLYQFYES